MASTTEQASERGRAEFVAGIATIAIGLALLAAVPQLRHCVSLVADGRFGALRGYIRSLGASGFVLLLGLMVIHAIVWYPSEIVTTTAGYVYGFVPGFLFALCGWLLCGLCSYALGRSVGRPLLQRLLGRRFETLTTTLERGGSSLLLSGRLIPVVPFALLGYAAGGARISVWRFAWTTVVGYVPLTAAVAYLGSQAKTFSTSNPLVWLAVVGLVALVVAEQYVRHRGRRRRASEASALGIGDAER